MSARAVKTNNVPRDVIEAWELSPVERAEFDYIDWARVETGEASAQFFRYRGELYDIGEFERVPDVPWLSGWDGYQCDTFFSATVIRYVDDFERVVVGRVYS